jgi:hypothetical protein
LRQLLGIFPLGASQWVFRAHFFLPFLVEASGGAATGGPRLPVQIQYVGVACRLTPRHFLDALVARRLVNTSVAIVMTAMTNAAISTCRPRTGR